MQCFYCSKPATRTVTNASVSQVILNVCKHCFYWHGYSGDSLMKKATFTFEQLDANTGEGCYKLKLEGPFKTHIEPMVQFIKGLVPSSDRLYDPNSREWTYSEKYDQFIRTAIQAAGFQIDELISKQKFQEFKKKQEEAARSAGQSLQSRQIPIGQDLQQFRDLLISALIVSQDNGIPAMKIIENWTKEEAISAYKKAIRFYHPDLHPERAEQASQLNEVWSRLKEAYYIK